MADPRQSGLFREVKIAERTIFVLTARGLEALGFPDLAEQQREAAKVNLANIARKYPRVEPTTQPVTADATAGMRRGVR